MLRAADDEHRHDQGEKQKAGHGEVGHLATLLSRLIEPFKNGCRQEPYEQDGGADDDAVAPRHAGTATTILNGVKNDPRYQTECNEERRIDQSLFVDRLQPFEAREF